LLHGLTGAPAELLPVAQRLNAAGMRCLGPVMAGHGGDARALIGVRWADWVAEARRHLCALEGSRRTLVVGSSMGALVACVLAHEHPERIDGLALLAPALRLTRAGRLGGLLGRALPGLVLPKTSGIDVRDPEAKRTAAAMAHIPLAAVAELIELQREVDRFLPGIVAPALVVAGGQDHTVTLSGARRLARRIGSGPSPVVLLPRSYHLVGIDVERDRCAEEVLEFFRTIPVPRAGRVGSARAAGGEGKNRPQE
jgi:carboxylesterase